MAAVSSAVLSPLAPAAVCAAFFVLAGAFFAPSPFACAAFAGTPCPGGRRPPILRSGWAWRVRPCSRPASRRQPWLPAPWAWPSRRAPWPGRALGRRGRLGHLRDWCLRLRPRCRRLSILDGCRHAHLLLLPARSVGSRIALVTSAFSRPSLHDLLLNGCQPLAIAIALRPPAAAAVAQVSSSRASRRRRAASPAARHARRRGPARRLAPSARCASRSRARSARPGRALRRSPPDRRWPTPSVCARRSCLHGPGRRRSRRGTAGRHCRRSRSPAPDTEAAAPALQLEAEGPPPAKLAAGPGPVGTGRCTGRRTGSRCSASARTPARYLRAVPPAGRRSPADPGWP